MGQVQVTEDLGDPVEVADQEDSVEWEVLVDPVEVEDLEELVEGLGELVEGLEGQVEVGDLEGPVEVADQEVDLKDLDCKQELGKNSEFQKDGKFFQICFQ